MNRRAFLSTAPALPAALAIPSLAVGVGLGVASKGSSFAFARGERVTIVTDIGRGGTIRERRIGYMANELPDYLIRRDFNGACEWYPETVLTAWV